MTTAWGRFLGLSIHVTYSDRIVAFEAGLKENHKFGFRGRPVAIRDILVW